ncbi:MAG: hypothetical protein ACKV2T_23120 [Kofleriaceae bacterium]
MTTAHGDRFAPVMLARRVLVALALAPGLAHAQPGTPVDPWSPPPQPTQAGTPVDPWSPPPPAPPTPPEPAVPPIEPPAPPAEPPAEAAPPAEPPTETPATLVESPVETPLPSDAVPVSYAVHSDRWPLSLPARPLLLPDGSSSFVIGTRLSLYDALLREQDAEISAVAGATTLGVAHVFGKTELGARGTFLLFQSQDAPMGQELRFARVNGISGSIRRQLGKGAALEASLSAHNVGSDYQGWASGVGVTEKAHLGPRAAFLVYGGLFYERAVFEDRSYPRFVDYSNIGLSLGFAVEANVAEHVNLFAGTWITQNRILDAPENFGADTYREHSSRLALVLVPNANVDVWFNLNLMSTGSVDAKSFALFLDLRRLR